MKLGLAYGRGTLTAAFPDQTDVFVPRHLPGLPDERSAFVQVLREPIGAPPLRNLIPKDAKVALVISDLTRPTPNDRLVPWLLDELAAIPRERFVIINGTGTHRPNTPAELTRMLGADVVQTVRVV
ncbi:MAG TPA: lactate racemase domain-containing protein, partial [Symbiobacteriaceae bacterium]|nr:lactate racemase domain-containing protein [Symbiobacteriaceae bacterium]